MKETILKSLVVVPTVVVSTVITVAVMKTISRRIDNKKSKKNRKHK